jgi:hypothetical protein
LTRALAITIIHNPADIKIPVYTFLINLNSLLIAGILSFVQGQLTQNDAIFIFVAAISPASLYTWAISLRAIFNKFPGRMVAGLPTKREQIILITLSFVPFVLWAILMGLTFSPSSHLTFSQPACYIAYDAKTVWSLLWAAIFVGCFALSSVVIGGRPLLLPRRPKQDLSYRN